jgi:hypothetical protein
MAPALLLAARMRTLLLLATIGACASSRLDGADVDGAPAAPADAADAIVDGADVPVGPDGAPISTCGVAGIADVATGPIPSRLPMIVWNGSRYALVFQTTTAPEQTRFAFADRDGALVPGSIRSVNPAGTVGQLAPTIAWSGSEYLVMYTAARNGDDIEVVRVDANGEPIAGSVVTMPTLAGSNGWGTVAWDPIDQRWGAEWINSTTQPYQSTVRLARLSSAGAKLGEVQANPGTSCCMLNYLDARVIWGGSRFAIAWETKGALHVSEITGAGVVTTPAVFPSSSTAWDPQSVALASNGAGYAIVYTDHDDATGRYVVHFARTDANGYVPGSDHVISSPGAFGDNPSVVWTGSEYGVAWSERGATNVNEIWSARLDASGAIIDGTRRQLTCGGRSNLWPEIAWDGSRYAIAYEHDVNGPEQAVHLIVGTVAGGGPQ